jgi:hypothetical protein
LNEEEAAYLKWANEGGMIAGEPSPIGKRNLMHENPERAPTIHASIWDPQKDLVKDDPDMKRAYAKLPPTK